MTVRTHETMNSAETIKTVKRLWLTHSSMEIAAICGKSRSAVCGIAHRAGLSKVRAPRAKKPKPAQPQANAHKPRSATTPMSGVHFNALSISQPVLEFTRRGQL